MSVDRGAELYEVRHAEPNAEELAARELAASIGTVSYGRVLYRASTGDQAARRVVTRHANRGHAASQGALDGQPEDAAWSLPGPGGDAA